MKRQSKEDQQGYQKPVINYKPSMKGQQYNKATHLNVQTMKRNKIEYDIEEAIILNIIIEKSYTSYTTIRIIKRILLKPTI